MERLKQQLSSLMPSRIEGTITGTSGTTAVAEDFPVPIGAQVEIQRHAESSVAAEVIGFRENMTVLFPLQEMGGVRRGSRVRLRHTAPLISAGDGLLGRVVNAHGYTIDGRVQPSLSDRISRNRPAPPAISRPPVDFPFSTGVRAIDGLLTCGKGQRMGIFSSAGVGKSVLLGMMARHSDADVNVIALVGERGREVNEFVHRELGPEGMARSVVVVATSDEPAPLRLQAAFVATAVAEYFRDRGQDVLLLMDSLSRVAMAQREIGLAAGEPPVTKGYPPSVYGVLPRLIERTGRTESGSITAFYSVLVEGEESQDPLSDLLRGLLDGHCVLSRRYASEGQYPAVDVLQSVSRLMPAVVDAEQLTAAQRIRRLISVYAEHEDLISIGAYRSGSNPLIDEAVTMREAIREYLSQRMDEPTTLPEARKALLQLAHTGTPPTMRAAVK